MPFGEGKKNPNQNQNKTKQKPQTLPNKQTKTKTPKTFETEKLFPEIKELNFGWLVWVTAVPGDSTWDEIKTVGIGAAYSYSTEILQLICRKKEALYLYSWFLLVGDLQYRGLVICPGAVAKLEIELWHPFKFLNGKTSLHLRSSSWSAEVRVMGWRWKSSADLGPGSIKMSVLLIVYVIWKRKGE